MNNIESRFLNYVSFNTTANSSSNTCPSTPNQILLGKQLVIELQELGLDNAYIDEFGYVYAYLPGNMPKNKTIALLAHMDTSEDASGEDVKPQIIEQYDGKDIIINKEQNIVLSPELFPALKKRIGHRLITTDGTTLLGADDKAGIAIIMDVVEKLVSNPDLQHPNLIICFTPDEEIGRGTDHLNYKYFMDHKCQVAYTLDGSSIDNVTYENFNAASALITITGKSIHPGSAKGKMINSTLLAMEFNALLPHEEIPALTEGYQGFYHLNYIEGEVSKTVMSYIIRNHDMEKFLAQKAFMQSAIAFLNNKYQETLFDIKITDSYYNMKEIVMTKPEILIAPVKALKRHKLDATFLPIRGGTDGARMSYSGVITPNLGTGGDNFHGPYEYLDVTDMQEMVQIILTMLSIYE